MAQEKQLRFSVVIPVYNSGRWVAEAVESALGQGRDDVEVIVVDDGSTDDTPAVLARFAGRARVIRQENGGVSVARNRGIGEARGEWIAFLDADDRFRPGHLDRLDRAASAHPDAGLIYADAMLIDGEGREIKPKTARDPGPDPFTSLLLRNVITTSATAVRAGCLNQVGAFYPVLKGPEDWDLWLRLAARFTVARIPEISVDYRKHGAGLVHTRGVSMREDNLTVIARAASLRPGLPEEVIRKARANCFLESAVRLAAGEEASATRQELVSALRLNPMLPAAWALFALTLGGRPALRMAMSFRRRRERVR
ncbi:MAG TPA: glycosyltransferase [bacterium]|nr:glycosyltransferase [bacterium]